MRFIPIPFIVCLFVVCEPTPYFFSINFHFMSEDTAVKTSDISVEIMSKKKNTILDSTAFTICPECDNRFVFDTVPGYSSKILMTDFYEFYEDETPVVIDVNILDTLKKIKDQVSLVVERSKPSRMHGCLIYIAENYNKNDSSIINFYNAATRKAHDSLRIQSTPITGSSDSLFVVYVE